MVIATTILALVTESGIPGIVYIDMAVDGACSRFAHHPQCPSTHRGPLLLNYPIRETSLRSTLVTERRVTTRTMLTDRTSMCLHRMR